MSVGLRSIITCRPARAEEVAALSGFAQGAYERLGFVATGPEEKRDGMRYLPMRRAGVAVP